MSYDPTIGRFISEDPIAFDGRDANLYRYVGNDPTNGIDPTGDMELPPGGSYDNDGKKPPEVIPPPGPGKNAPAPWSLFGPWPYTKPQILAGIPTLNPTPPPPGTTYQPTSGNNNNVYPTIPPGTVVGPGGCGTCVGVVLIPNNPATHPTIVYHFTALDSPIGTIPNLGPNYTAVICGAEQTGSSVTDPQALQTLQDTVVAVKHSGAKIVGYVPSEGFGVGPGGEVYWTTPAGQNTTCYPPNYKPPKKD